MLDNIFKSIFKCFRFYSLHFFVRVILLLISIFKNIIPSSYLLRSKCLLKCICLIIKVASEVDAFDKWLVKFLYLSQKILKYAVDDVTSMVLLLDSLIVLHTKLPKLVKDSCLSLLEVTQFSYVSLLKIICDLFLQMKDSDQYSKFSQDHHECFRCIIKYIISSLQDKGWIKLQSTILVSDELFQNDLCNMTFVKFNNEKNSIDFYRLDNAKNQIITNTFYINNHDVDAQNLLNSTNLSLHSS